MAFVLDGDDNLSPVFRRIGESAERFHQRINRAVDESGGELRAFTRASGGGLQALERNLGEAGRAATEMGEDANRAAPSVRELGEAARDTNAEVERFTRDSNGRIRALNGRFVNAAEAARLLAREADGTAQEVRDLGDASGSSAVRVRDLGDGADRARPSVARLGAAAGKAGAEVGGKGGGMGGALWAVAAIAGLSFLPAIGALVPMMAGAAVAAGTVKLGFSGVGEAMEAAGKGKKEYAEALKKLTPEARAFTKELVLTKGEFSGLSDRIQAVMLPGFTAVLHEASPIIQIVASAMTEMGKGFGDAAAGVSRLMKDQGFRKEFTTVLQLGNVFVRDLTRGLGGLTQGFLHFGAVSEPTLRSLSGGISDLLGKGLPGMFQGLERGVSGSARFLDGLFGMLNELLPALGRFSGEVARTFGPFLGEQMTLFGHIISRALDLVGAAARALKPVFDDLTYGLKAAWLIAQPFASAFKEAGKAIIEAMLPAGQSVENFRGPLQRLHTVVQENKLGLMEYARIGANIMMTVAEGFIRYLPVVVTAFHSMASIALTSFEAILGAAVGTFGWIPGIGDKLRAASADFDRFKSTFLGGLKTAEDETRAFSASVAPRLSENRLKLNISSWEAQIVTAKGQLASVPPEKRSQLLAHIADLENKVADAKQELRSVQDRHVGIYVTTYRTEKSMYHPQSGGREKATGGIIRGPGTSTSDSIPAWLSDGEYVLRASAVSRIGVSNLDALNQGRSFALPAGQTTGSAAPAVAARGTGITFAPQITVNGAMDPTAVAQQMERLLLKLQRNYGLQTGVLSR